MDELELLKQDWKRQDKNLPHVESDEIRKMMHKKSTSIVKWIFIISIAEFLFWIGIESLSFFDESYQMIKEIGIESFYKISLVINYTAVFIFIYLFYRNFRKISTSDNVRILMRNIIITRKTVKAYVWFNLIFFSICFLITGYMTLDNLWSDDTMKVKIISLVMLLVVLIIILLLIVGFYILLYGILTKKLYKNYKTLKEIDKD